MLRSSNRAPKPVSLTDRHPIFCRFKILHHACVGIVKRTTTPEGAHTIANSNSIRIISSCCLCCISEWTPWGWTGQWWIHRVCEGTRNEVDRPFPPEPSWKHSKHRELNHCWHGTVEHQLRPQICFVGMLVHYLVASWILSNDYLLQVSSVPTKEQSFKNFALRT